MRRSLIFLLPLLAACASSPTDSAQEPRPDLAAVEVNAVDGQNFRLAPNEVAVSADGTLFVTFRRVDADSRCPVDVTCVWQGNAEVVIGTAAAGGNWTWHELNSGIDPNRVNVGSHTVQLIAVHPETRANRTIPQGDYRVELRITRA